jgi:hypothetical protein
VWPSAGGWKPRYVAPSDFLHHFIGYFIAAESQGLSVNLELLVGETWFQNSIPIKCLIKCPIKSSAKSAPA